MIKNNEKEAKSFKRIAKEKKVAEEKKIHDLCEAYAKKRFTEEQLKKWSNEHKGLWFLPVFSDDEDDDTIIAMAVMKPINRHILNYASTKIQDEGLYTFLEECMRNCFIDGDNSILDDDDFFIPASQKFNKILEGNRAALVKR